MEIALSKKKLCSVYMYFNRIFSEYKADQEWFFMKLSFSLPVLLYVFFILHKYNTILFPRGMCWLFDCTLFIHPCSKVLILFLVFILTLFYIFEKHMLFATGGLASLSMFLLTVEESNGNPAENGIITLLFFAQFLAYLGRHFKCLDDFYFYRKQFSVQIVSSVYFLSGISKLKESGIAWFTTDSKLFTLEVLRVYYSKYAATGIVAFEQKGWQVANFLSVHPDLLVAILFTAIFVELGSIMLIVYSKIWVLYGLCLLLMHLGIYVVMGLTFPTIMIPMLAVLVNPLHLLVESRPCRLKK